MIKLDRLQRRAVFGSGKRSRNAVAHLQAFERVAERLMHEQAVTRSLMSADTAHRFNDPRYERGTAVTATEIRGSRRWTASRGHSDDVTVIAGLPLWLTSALDTATIARLWPSRVTVMEAAASGTETPPVTRRRARGTDPSTTRAARLRSAAGTIRMGEQD
jgi:hypothetical protein